MVIGRRGVGIRALTEQIEKKFELQNPQVSVLEIEVPELDPQVMCNKISHLVSRGTAFRRAALWTMNSIMGAGAMGVEISISGKLRSERAHHEKYRDGVVPKSGETAKRIVREAKQDVLLKMGLYGIKVKIALKDAIPPEVEIKAVTPEEVKAAEAVPTVVEEAAPVKTEPAAVVVEQKIAVPEPEVKKEIKAEVTQAAEVEVKPEAAAVPVEKKEAKEVKEKEKEKKAPREKAKSDTEKSSKPKSERRKKAVAAAKEEGEVKSENPES
ncbi:MAG: 30S ribosomal protein S3 [Thaumarchaeota archaeon]|nr:30S ribosomal protein S3 [Nitrososphaerota archaeon]